MEALIPLASALVALAALVYAFLKDRKGEQKEDASALQGIRDKLDYISDTARDTREDVRALDRKLDDHSSRLARVEASVEGLSKRVETLERR